jgi:hypothetical protein
MTFAVGNPANRSGIRMRRGKCRGPCQAKIAKTRDLICGSHLGRSHQALGIERQRRARSTSAQFEQRKPNGPEGWAYTGPRSSVLGPTFNSTAIELPAHRWCGVVARSRISLARSEKAVTPCRSALTVRS